jgi:hypothetical protein
MSNQDDNSYNEEKGLLLESLLSTENLINYIVSAGKDKTKFEKIYFEKSNIELDKEAYFLTLINKTDGKLYFNSSKQSISMCFLGNYGVELSNLMVVREAIQLSHLVSESQHHIILVPLITSFFQHRLIAICTKKRIGLDSEVEINMLQNDSFQQFSEQKLSSAIGTTKLKNLQTSEHKVMKAMMGYIGLKITHPNKKEIELDISQRDKVQDFFCKIHILL